MRADLPGQPSWRLSLFGDLAQPRVGASAQPRTSHGIADHEWRCWPLHKNAMAELAHIGMSGQLVALKGTPLTDHYRRGQRCKSRFGRA
jgi:hypothetical protein